MSKNNLYYCAPIYFYDLEMLTDTFFRAVQDARQLLMEIHRTHNDIYEDTKLAYTDYLKYQRSSLNI